MPAIRYSATYARPRLHRTGHVSRRDVSAPTAGQHPRTVLSRLDAAGPRRPEHRCHGADSSRYRGGGRADRSAPRRADATGRGGQFCPVARRRFAARGRFVLLADQDDVWHEDKVARQVAALQPAENLPAKNGSVPPPRLVFCDAAVIDAAGRTLTARSCGRIDCRTKPIARWRRSWAAASCWAARAR